MLNNSSQFITCPKCNGLGKTDQGLICNECKSISTGTFIKNDFLYWGYNLTSANIILRRAGAIFNAVSSIFGLILGISGILALIYWAIENVIINGYQIKVGTLLSFWGETNYYILAFWLGLLILLFTYFRFKRQQAKFVPVKTFKYNDWQKLNKQVQNVPNNWNELKSYKTKIDVAKSFSKESIKAIEEAYNLALNNKHQEVTPLHLFYTIIKKQNQLKNIELKKINSLFYRLEIFQGKIEPRIKDMLRAINVSNSQKIIDPVATKLLKQSFIQAYLNVFDQKQAKVEIIDLLTPLVKNEPQIKELLNSLQINEHIVDNTVFWTKINNSYQQNIIKRLSIKLKLNNKLTKTNIAVATPILNYFCQDLTLRAESGFTEIPTERVGELESIFNSFQSNNKFVILTGQKGIGKNILVKMIAKKINNNNTPKILNKKRIFELNLKKLIGEAQGVDLEKKLIAVIGELNKAKDIILFIKNITPEIWQIINKYPAKYLLLATSVAKIQSDNVSNVEILELQGDELIQNLESQATSLEIKNKVFFTYGAIMAIIHAGDKYITDRPFPAKGIELLNDAVNFAKSKQDANITSRTISETIAQKYNVPYTKVLK